MTSLTCVLRALREHVGMGRETGRPAGDSARSHTLTDARAATRARLSGAFPARSPWVSPVKSTMPPGARGVRAPLDPGGRHLKCHGWLWTTRKRHRQGSQWRCVSGPSGDGAEIGRPSRMASDLSGIDDSSVPLLNRLRGFVSMSGTLVRR